MSVAWLGLLWGMVCGVAVLWVSFLGYRDPQSNRVTAWMDRLYRRSWSGDLGQSVSRERFLQNMWVCGMALVLGLVVIVRELVK